MANCRDANNQHCAKQLEAPSSLFQTRGSANGHTHMQLKTKTQSYVRSRTYESRWMSKHLAMENTNNPQSDQLREALTTWTNATNDMHDAIGTVVSGGRLDPTHIAMLRARVETARLACELLVKHRDRLK